VCACKIRNEGLHLWERLARPHLTDTAIQSLGNGCNSADRSRIANIAVQKAHSTKRKSAFLRGKHPCKEVNVVIR
jgi:hypothetical protein